MKQQHIHRMTVAESEEVSRKLKEVFATYVADSCLHGGREGFERYVAPANLLARREEGCEVWLYKRGNMLAAISELMLPAHITLIFVLPEYQGTGVGRELFEYILTRIRMHNRDKEEVGVTVNAVPAATGFYSRLGFEAVSDKMYVEGIPTIPMRMTLEV